MSTHRSLLVSSSFLSLIGRDFLTENHRARLILTHKFLLVRVPSSPHHALFTLLGCMATSHNALPFLRKSVGAVLGVWSDPTSIRHMDRRQHVWISKIVVLGVSLLQELGELEQDRAGTCLATLKIDVYLLEAGSIYIRLERKKKE